MARQRLWVALHAALARGDVGHRPDRRHVAGLTLLATLGSGAFLPFRVGRVDFDAEDGPLMTGGAVTALLVDGKMAERLAGPDGVFQRAVEELVAVLGA